MGCKYSPAFQAGERPWAYRRKLRFRSWRRVPSRSHRLGVQHAHLQCECLPFVLLHGLLSKSKSTPIPSSIPSLATRTIRTTPHPSHDPFLVSFIHFRSTCASISFSCLSHVHVFDAMVPRSPPSRTLGSPHTPRCTSTRPQRHHSRQIWTTWWPLASTRRTWRRFEAAGFAFQLRRGAGGRFRHASFAVNAQQRRATILVKKLGGVEAAKLDRRHVSTCPAP